VEGRRGYGKKNESNGTTRGRKDSVLARRLVFAGRGEGILAVKRSCNVFEEFIVPERGESKSACLLSLLLSQAIRREGSNSIEEKVKAKKHL